MTKQTDLDHDEKNLTYKKALEELEKILLGLESDEVDVDELAKKVSRANILLKHCQERLTTAQLEVETIIDTLEVN
tara:strand:- start:894 stop:1121 length:228 start_codon:yes stop_codon:yes gene_type:complete